MSLRVRLTILTATLVALATTALGVAIYATAQRLQLDQVDARLYADISEARVRSMQDDPRPPQDGVYVDTALGRVNRDGVSILPLRAAGTLEEPIALPPLSPDDLRAAAASPITIHAGIDFRVAVRSHGPGLATVVAAAPLTDVEANLALLARAIFAFSAAVAALGALASWLLVRQAFKPMDAMVAASDAIAHGETDRRLPDAAPATEIGRLTSAMNAMIDSLATAITRAESSEGNFRRFVSDASHEIRTPLTVIRGYSELLLRNGQALGQPEQRALERIESESRRLDRLVTALLSLERSSAQGAAEAASVDVCALVCECADDLAVLDPSRAVTRSLPSVVHAWTNADALRQLLANAAQNVLRHTPSGSPVEFTVTANDARVSITVDDSGPGISVERRERLQRGETSSPDGFGLGLAIMTALAAHCGGTLSLQESPSGGLRVLVDLAAHPTPA